MHWSIEQMKALRRYDQKKENYKLLEQIYIYTSIAFRCHSMPLCTCMHCILCNFVVLFVQRHATMSINWLNLYRSSVFSAARTVCIRQLFATSLVQYGNFVSERERERRKKHHYDLTETTMQWNTILFFFAVSILLEGSIPFYAWAERNLHLTQTRIHRTNGRPNDNSPTIRKHSKRPTCLSANMREKWSVYMAFFWCVCMYVCERSVLPFEMK